MTFVVVGAGPTGVELAGAMAEISRHTLKGEFRNIDPALARIVLIESSSRVLPTFPEELSVKAAASLKRLGVNIMTGCTVCALDSERVTLQCGSSTETITARIILWAAGVAASPLGKVLVRSTNCELDRIGRVIVEPDLSIPGWPQILVIGDMAHCKDESSKPLPGVAPVAMQQGQYIARLIDARLHGKKIKAFRYRDRGSMATIGRSAAVADLHWAKFSGLPAWVVWLCVHLIYMVQFQNRLLILIQWAWNYFTRNRSARLITEPSK